METHVFRADWQSMARLGLLNLYAILGIILFLIYRALDGAFPDQGVIASVAILIVVFGAPTEFLRFRRRRNQPILVVARRGVAFPTANTGYVSWADIQTIEIRQASYRMGGFKFLRFHFRDGTLKRRQFGSLRKDRFELIIETGSLVGRRSTVVGGTANLVQSIERFHDVKEKK